jgi:hypothetical protein
MSKQQKLLFKILRGTSDAHIPFDGLRNLLIHLKFKERIKGDHHIFTREDIEAILNLQPKGSQAKPYQVRQVRQILVKYQLGGSDDAEV